MAASAAATVPGPGMSWLPAHLKWWTKVAEQFWRVSAEPVAWAKLVSKAADQKKSGVEEQCHKIQLFCRVWCFQITREVPPQKNYLVMGACDAWRWVALQIIFNKVFWSLTLRITSGWNFATKRTIVNLEASSGDRMRKLNLSFGRWVLRHTVEGSSGAS